MACWAEPSMIGSRFLHSSDTVLLENLVPHNSSVIWLTFLVDTPFTAISIRANRSDHSLLRYLKNISVEKLPSRILGTWGVMLPTRVVTCRGYEPFRCPVSSSVLSYGSAANCSLTCACSIWFRTDSNNSANPESWGFPKKTSANLLNLRQSCTEPIQSPSF